VIVGCTARIDDEGTAKIFSKHLVSMPDDEHIIFKTGYFIGPVSNLLRVHLALLVQ
jgi:hypothetical protein